MKNFIKIEKLVTKFGSNVEDFIYLNVNTIVGIYVKDDLVRISTIDGHTETTKMKLEEVLKLLK